MRNRGNSLCRLFPVAIVIGALAGLLGAAPMTRLNIVVKAQGGKPIDRASVVVRFVEGHSIVKLGKAVRTTFELRTNQEGEAQVPSIPQGKIRIQIIAKGFQTFGQIFDVSEEEKKIEITLNPRSSSTPRINPAHDLPRPEPVEIARGAGGPHLRRPTQ